MPISPVPSVAHSPTIASFTHLPTELKLNVVDQILSKQDVKSIFNLGQSSKSMHGIVSGYVNFEAIKDCHSENGEGYIKHLKDSDSIVRNYAISLAIQKMSKKYVDREMIGIITGYGLKHNESLPIVHALYYRFWNDLFDMGHHASCTVEWAAGAIDVFGKAAQDFAIRHFDNLDSDEIDFRRRLINTTKLSNEVKDFIAPEKFEEPLPNLLIP